MARTPLAQRVEQAYGEVVESRTTRRELLKRTTAAGIAVAGAGTMARVAKAAHGATTPRLKAERLTRYVNALLDKKPTVSLPSAREVLRTRVVGYRFREPERQAGAREQRVHGLALRLAEGVIGVDEYRAPGREPLLGVRIDLRPPPHPGHRRRRSGSIRARSVGAIPHGTWCGRPR